MHFREPPRILFFSLPPQQSAYVTAFGAACSAFENHAGCCKNNGHRRLTNTAYKRKKCHQKLTSSIFNKMTILDARETFSTHNDFRSDTFTVPTRRMNEVVMEKLSLNSLALGDSVYKEDPYTLELEAKFASLTGKEAALFCVSGTLSNQIGLRAALQQPPYSILCDYRAHIYLHEAGGTATLSQAMVHPVTPENGNYLTLEDIIEEFTPDDGDIHAAPTKVISLENTLHGILYPVEEIRRISEFARSQGIWMHLDGARLINAAVASGVSLEEYCSLFDSVSICLSKSLGAPIGSILVGDAKYIEKANHFKKQAGGGIRQAGMMTLMALTALEDNWDKISVAHAYAKDVGDFCKKHDIALESPVDTNFVFIDLKKNKMNDALLVKCAENHGVKLMGGRIAFHFQQSEESVENLKAALYECKQDALKNPFEGKRSKKQMYNVDVVKSLASLSVASSTH